MRVSELAKKAKYGIVTEEILDEIFSKRMLAADLLSRSDEYRTSHAASMILQTLQSVRKELEGLIS